MAKKSKSDQAKRSQNRALKAKRREKNLATLAAAREAADRLKKKVRADSLVRFVTEEYEFWLLHGMNFLSSDYEEGIWSPLFPEAYEEGFVPLDRTTTTKRLMEHYLDPETNRLSKTGTKCLAWAALKPSEMFDFVFRIRRSQTHEKKDKSWVESRKPANPSVWVAVHEAMNLVSAGLDAKGNTKDGEFTFPKGEVSPAS